MLAVAPSDTTMPPKRKNKAAKAASVLPQKKPRKFARSRINISSDHVFAAYSLLTTLAQHIRLARVRALVGRGRFVATALVEERRIYHHSL